ncbi:MAG: hypothetical protein OEO77_11975 [Acidimicrobiia bacterium]|nr:hypothetical protein [Acidimicrobiia bacterium]
MMCIACGGWSTPRVCARCERSIRPAPDRSIDGVVVRSAFVHDGAARRLVHRVKYEGSRLASHQLATAMAPLVPPCDVVVPIPRVTIRRWMIGADGGGMLAEAVAGLVARPVEQWLRSPIWQAPHAGRSRDRRRSPRLRGTRRHRAMTAVLVDDVVTTGATIASALAAIRSTGGDPGSVVGVVCATSAARVTSVYRVPGPRE